MKSNSCAAIVSLISLWFCLFSVQAALAIEPGKIRPTQHPTVKQIKPQPPGTAPSPANPPVHSGNNDINIKRDFRISDIRFPSAVYEGDPIEWNTSSSLLVQVSYSGLLPSPQCRVKITCSGIGYPPSLVGELSFTSMQSGQSKWVSLPVYGTNNAKWGNFGSYTFEAVVDPDGSCGDTNTTNNKRSVNVTVRKKIPGGLNPPSDFKAVLGPYSGMGFENVTLSWKDNSTAEGSFLIERSENNGPFTHEATVPANTTKKHFSSHPLVKPETIYIYRISACKGSPSPPCSEPVLAQFFTPPIPAFPTGIKAIALSKNFVKVVWNDVANEWGYMVWRWFEGQNPQNAYMISQTAENVTSLNDNTVLPNQTSCYTVYPFNAFLTDLDNVTYSCVKTPAQ